MPNDKAVLDEKDFRADVSFTPSHMMIDFYNQYGLLITICRVPLRQLKTALEDVDCGSNFL